MTRIMIKSLIMFFGSFELSPTMTESLLNTRVGNVPANKPNKNCSMCSTHKRETKLVKSLQKALIDNISDQRLHQLINTPKNSKSQKLMLDLLKSIRPNSINEKSINSK